MSVSDDAESGAGLVHLDRIGTVEAPADGTPLRTFVAGLPDAGRQRLEETGQHTVTDDVDALDRVDLVVISTRLPRAELRPVLATVQATTDKPIIALAHTGGEGMAVDVMRAGGVGVVAEGNEAALRALLDGRAHDQSLLETYDRHVSQTAAFDPMRGRDRATGLPGPGAFEQRVADLIASGEVPRVMMVRVLGLDGHGSRLSPEGITLLRRRLAVSLRRHVEAEGAELFSLDDTDFGVVSPDLSPNRAAQLARLMAAVTETYAPQGIRPLALAAGHAGPETSLDLAPLPNIAKRALEVAASEKRSNVVGAEELALGVSSTTELEAVQQAVALVERYAPYGEGHAQRVAEWGGEIAWQMGFEGQARTRVQLAGMAHDAGLVGMPRECLENPASLEGELLEVYRSHPVRASDWLRASAGTEVADAVRSHHEHWDGSGYPDGLLSEEIPIAARIIRVADTLDALLTGTDPAVGRALSAADALVELESRSGVQLDPAVVEVALPVLDKLLSARDT